MGGAKTESLNTFNANSWPSVLDRTCSSFFHRHDMPTPGFQSLVLRYRHRFHFDFCFERRFGGQGFEFQAVLRHRSGKLLSLPVALSNLHLVIIRDFCNNVNKQFFCLLLLTFFCRRCHIF